MARKITLLSFLAFLPVMNAYSSDCEVRVVASGTVSARQAVSEDQLRLPAPNKFAVIKVSKDLPLEVLANNIQSREAANTRAAEAATDTCPVQDKTVCQMQLEAPNQVVVKISALDRNNRETFVDGLIFKGSKNSDLQSNINLLKNRHSALGCKWEKGATQECSISRSFDFESKIPKYNVKIGNKKISGMSGLNYESAMAIYGRWNEVETKPNPYNDEQVSDVAQFLKADPALVEVNEPVEPSCEFNPMPSQLMCSIGFENGGHTVKYDSLGHSKRLEDRESACNRLSEKVTSGECAMSSPIGDDPCTHSGVYSGARSLFAPSKFRENLESSANPGLGVEH